MSDRTGQPGESLVFTVVRGRPAPAELAAALTVLLAARATSAAVATAPQAGAVSSQWAERSRALTAFPRPGPGSWRASALPH